MRGQVTEVFKIYDSRDKQLLIPVYQRNYDWKPRHCAQLIVDLKSLVGTGKKHFFGAVVGQPEGSWRWVVIDGQQRLTTVSLIMLALSDLIATEELECVEVGLGEKIKNNFLLTDRNSAETRFRLKPVKDDSEAYRRLFGPESEFIESSNVTANYRYFIKELPQMGCSADEIWDAVCRLEVMHLDLEKDDHPQRIFESLNSTGLALSEADKVRNLVLMSMDSKTQNRIYEDYWNRIEKNVEFETDTFLRWYLVTKTSKTPRINNVYEAFKVFSNRSERQGEGLLEEIRDYSVHYNQLRSAHTGSRQVDARLRRLNLLKQDVVLPLFMPLLAEYRIGTVTEKDLTASIRIVESYLFRRFICEIPTNSLNNLFATLYKDVRKLRTGNTTFAETLAYSLERRTGSGLFPGDEQFRDAFATKNLYKVQTDRRRYIFECLENLNSNDTRDIANALERGDISVEHIMPQTLSEFWNQSLGEESETIHQTWLHRIGNLTVTGYNSMYSNSPFEFKQQTENGFRDSPYRLNKFLRDIDKWGEPELTRRSHEITDDAISYWEYPETSFIPPTVQLPVEPLGTDTDFTNRAIAAFEYEDNKITVRTWLDFLLQIFRILIVMNREKVFEFASTSDWFVVGERSAEAKYGLREIVPGLHLIAQTSTSSKTAMLRRVFDHLHLDPEELIITLGRADEKVENRIEVPFENSPYGELIKFLQPLESLVGLNSTLEDTSDLRAEFRVVIESFKIDSFLSVLGQKPAKFAADPVKMNHATAEQVIALCSSKVFEEERLDPEAVADAISDGTLATWIRALAKSTEVPSR